MEEDDPSFWEDWIKYKESNYSKDIQQWTLDRLKNSRKNGENDPTFWEDWIKYKESDLGKFQHDDILNRLQNSRKNNSSIFEDELYKKYDAHHNDILN